MKKKTAIVPAKAKPLALPDSPFPIPKPGEDSENAAYLARVEKWYTDYFVGMPLTFTRADVGKAISPGDWYMRMCIKLLACNVIFVPRKDRYKFYAPLKFVLRAIAQTWDECAAPALSAVDHVEELQRLFDVDEKEPIQEDDLKREVAKVDAERAGLKDDLRKLSETLLNANAARADEMLAAINAVGEKVDAVGAVVKHTADNTDAIRADLDGWRDWLIAHKIVNAPNGSAGKRGKRPTDFAPELGFVNVRNAINQVWSDYTRGVADCELPGRLGKRGMRRFGQKRTYAECIAGHGDDKIWNGRTLRELLTVPGCGKTPEQVFEGIVHSAKETERQTRAKDKVRRKHFASAPQKRRRK